MAAAQSQTFDRKAESETSLLCDKEKQCLDTRCAEDAESKGFLAIVGSRNFTDKKQFQRHLDVWIGHYGEPQIIVTGCAKGVDQLAREYAKEHSIELKVFKADWKTMGKAAGPLRNIEILRHSTHVLAFPSKTGKGTQDTIKKAQKARMPCTIHFID